MEKILYLTSDEQALFDAVTDDVKAEWTVEEEVITHEDSDVHLTLRLAMADFDSFDVEELRLQAQDCTDEETVRALFKQMQENELSDDDIDELFFLLGPYGVSCFIELLLPNATSEDDLSIVAKLGIARRELVAAYVS